MTKTQGPIYEWACHEGNTMILSNKAVGRNITLPGGKKLFLGGSAPGAEGDGAEPSQKR